MALKQCRTGSGQYPTKAKAIKALGTMHVKQCRCCRLWGLSNRGRRELQR